MIQCCIKTIPIIDAYLRHCFALDNFYDVTARQNGLSPTFSYIEQGKDAYFVVQAKEQELTAEIIENGKHIDLCRFASQSELSFYIRLTPSIKTVKSYGVKTKNVIQPITQSNEVKMWIKNKIQSKGLNVNHIEILQSGISPSGKGMQILNERFVYISASVIDSQKALILFQNGMGKRKSFGYGMPVLEHTPGFLLIKSLFQHNI